MLTDGSTLDIKREKLQDITAARAGEKVLFRARVQTSRAQGTSCASVMSRIYSLNATGASTGGKMIFLLFRQQSATIQALVQVEPELVSKKMVKFAESISPESIVLVEGVVQKPLEPVRSCTVQEAEVKITKVSTRCTAVPVSVVRSDFLPCSDPHHL